MLTLAMRVTGGPALPRTEHILLESEEREVPDRRAARKTHAQLRFRSRLRRSTFVLDVYDYYFLSVEKRRGASVVAEYVLDLRFIDPRMVQSRRVAWRWIFATLSLLALFAGSVWYVSASTTPWWQHPWLPVCAILLAGASCAALISAYRTTETFTLQTVHGRAVIFELTGGLGTLRSIRPFITRLAAHIRIAIGARRRSRAEHLRDEMREHFRLKEAGVLGIEAYETSKARILRTHAT